MFEHSMFGFRYFGVRSKTKSYTKVFKKNIIFQTGDDRIILSWNALPRDLDLHLAMLGNCEVDYTNKNCPGAFLDVDHTSGYGPETITLESYLNATYMVYIYDFAPNNTHPMSTSNGKVDIIPDGYNAMSVNIPSNQETWNRYWVIGCFNGTEGLNNIKIVNTILDFPMKYCKDKWSRCEEICNPS